MSSDMLTRGLVIIVTMHLVMFAGQLFLLNIELPGITAFDESEVLTFLFKIDNNKISGLSEETAAAIPQSPQKVAVFSGTDSLVFVDALNLIWTFIRLLLGLIAAPFTIFLLLPSLNIVFAIFFSAWLGLLYLLGVIVMLRGSG